jgi:hypothetical protein
MKRQIIVSTFKLLFFATKTKHASYASRCLLHSEEQFPASQPARQPDRQFENYLFHHPCLPYACGVPLLAEFHRHPQILTHSARSLHDNLLESCNGYCRTSRDDYRGRKHQNYLACFLLLTCLTYLRGGSRALTIPLCCLLVYKMMWHRA